MSFDWCLILLWLPALILHNCLYVLTCWRNVRCAELEGLTKEFGRQLRKFCDKKNFWKLAVREVVHVRVGFLCNHGRHRSVGMCILTAALAKLSGDIKVVTNLEEAHCVCACQDCTGPVDWEGLCNFLPDLQLPWFGWLMDGFGSSAEVQHMAPPAPHGYDSAEAAGSSSKRPRREVIRGQYETAVDEFCSAWWVPVEVKQDCKLLLVCSDRI